MPLYLKTLACNVAYPAWRVDRRGGDCQKRRVVKQQASTQQCSTVLVFMTGSCVMSNAKSYFSLNMMLHSPPGVAAPLQHQLKQFWLSLCRHRVYAKIYVMRATKSSSSQLLESQRLLGGTNKIVNC